VGVLVAFPVCEVFAFGEEMWRWVRWWGLISVGGTNVVCVVLGHVPGRGEVGLGMFVCGVLWIYMYSSCVVVVVFWCWILGILGSLVILWLVAGCCVSGGILVIVGVLLGIVMFVGYARLRLCVCAFRDCLPRPVVVCLVRCSLRGVGLTKGESCITFCFSVVGYGLDSSPTFFIVVFGLTRREICLAGLSYCGHRGADVARVMLRGGRDGGDVIWSGLLAALSSGAHCLTSFFIIGAWGYFFCPCRLCFFFFFLGVGFVFGVFFHEGLVAREV